MPTKAQRPWTCRLGRHKYRRMRNDAGEIYDECSRCLKFRDAPAVLPPELGIG